MSTSTPNTPLTNFRAALHYAELGWPVLPGATWRDGHFIDPATARQVDSPCLRPVEEATTDAALVREWWQASGSHAPNVLTVTGATLGAFAIAESLAVTLAEDPWFAALPTPVLAFPTMPITYFLVRPPVPSVLLSAGARIVDSAVPLPLPPSDLDTAAATWLVTPEQAGNRLMPADALADLIHGYERTSA